MPSSNRNVLLAVVAAGATLALSDPVAAQQIPSGWQKVVNQAGTCQLSVPGDWTVEGGILPTATKGSTVYTAALTFTPPKAAFTTLRDDAKHGWQSRPEFTVVEESATRAVYRYKNAGHYQWTIVVAGSSTACQATLSAPSATDAMEAQIAKTFTAK